MNKGLLLGAVLAVAAPKALAHTPAKASEKNMTFPESYVGFEKPKTGNGVHNVTLVTRDQVKQLTAFVAPRTVFEVDFTCPDPATFNGWRAIDSRETEITCEAGKCAIEITAEKFDGATTEVLLKCVKGTKDAATGKFQDEEPLNVTVHTTTPGNYATPIVVREPAPQAPAPEVPIPPFDGLIKGKPISASLGVTFGQAGVGPELRLGLSPFKNSDERVRVTFGLDGKVRFSDEIVNLPNTSETVPTTSETRCGALTGDLEYDAINGSNVRGTVGIGTSLGVCHTIGSRLGNSLLITPSLTGLTSESRLRFDIGGRQFQIGMAIVYALSATDIQNGIGGEASCKVTY